MLLETARLTLRPWRVADAAFQRQLWLERDHRGPLHRRIDGDGHPTIADLQEPIRAGRAGVRVLSKLGFVETEREEATYGTNLLTTRPL